MGEGQGEGARWKITRNFTMLPPPLNPLPPGAGRFVGHQYKLQQIVYFADFGKRTAKAPPPTQYTEKT